MALVFLSYDRDDAPQAKRVAAALKEAGHKVWWDDLIKGGSQYTKEIEEALNTSDVVVVLWSNNSIQSAWVRDEAAAGRDRGCLVPVLIDKVEPPLGFRQFQNIDLSRWNGRGKHPQLRQLLDAMPIAQAEDVRAMEPPIPVKTTPSRLRFAWLTVLVLALIGGGYAAWRTLGGSRSSDVPMVAVVAGNDSVAAKEWARDVMVGLGGLEGDPSSSFRLIDETEQKPDLLIEVIGAPPSQNAEASLILRSAVDRSLLWSRKFERPNTAPADLRREVVNSAALILGCARDGFSSREPPVTDVLKTYLGGCWEQFGPDASDLSRMASTFLKVTEAAPGMERAWAGLLLAESELVRRSFPGVKEPLIRHIEQARLVNPRLAEAYLAEGTLQRPNDVSGRIRLADAAVAQDPRNALILMQRASELLAVGRMTDAVADAANAVQLQPLSPIVRDMHVYALQAAGQFETAREEIEKVARMWPGSSHVAFMRLRTAHIEGDADEAMKLSAAMTSWKDNLVAEAESAVFRARSEPTQDNVRVAIEKWRAVTRKWPDGVAPLIATLGTFGQTEEIFATLDRLKGRPELAPVVRDAIFRSTFRDFWRDPRSMQIAAQLGTLEYWRKSGNWPDFCFEADHPYDCKAVAGKLPS